MDNPNNVVKVVCGSTYPSGKIALEIESKTKLETLHSPIQPKWVCLQFEKNVHKQGIKCNLEIEVSASLVVKNCCHQY